MKIKMAILLLVFSCMSIAIAVAMRMSQAEVRTIFHEPSAAMPTPVLAPGGAAPAMAVKAAIAETRTPIQIASVQDIMSLYSTRTDQELRFEIERVMKFAEQRRLFEKANSGSISEQENRELAYLVRVHTALHRLLLDREMSRN